MKQTLEPVGQCPHEVKVDPPEAMMDVKEPTWKEVKGFCQKRQDQAKLPDQMEYLL